MTSVTPVNDDIPAGEVAATTSGSVIHHASTSDSVIPAAEPSPADQSQSKLMPLPRELRDEIFGYVFCDNVEWTREQVRYETGVGLKVENIPDRICFDAASPPSKDSILPCRQLHSEMKKMQAAAYRDCWSSNRFVYTCSDGIQTVPSADDVQHMQHISLPSIGKLAGEYFVDLVFEEGKWRSWLLPADDLLLESDEIDGDHWLRIQRKVNRRVLEAIDRCLPPVWPHDPCRSRGLHENVLMSIYKSNPVKIVFDGWYY